MKWINIYLDENSESPSEVVYSFKTGIIDVIFNDNDDSEMVMAAIENIKDKVEFPHFNDN